MLKYIFISIILLVSITLVSQTKKDTTTINAAKSIVNNNKQNNIKPSKDTLLIDLKHFDALTQLLDKDVSWWEKLSPSLFALLIVLISTGGTLYVGITQIKKQTYNAQEQIKSQEAQAQENLKVAREQIEKTSEMTLAQVRANNISMARINWMQDFRNEITNFNGEVAIINYYLRDVVELTKKGSKGEAKELYEKQAERIKNARQYSFKIKLFLNPKEKKHKELEKHIDEYFTTALENYSTVNSDFNVLSDKILNLSRGILKEVWEQAKAEKG